MTIWIGQDTKLTIYFQSTLALHLFLLTILKEGRGNITVWQSVM